MDALENDWDDGESWRNWGRGRKWSLEGVWPHGQLISRIGIDTERIYSILINMREVVR